MEATKKNWICGVSGHPIEIGDEYFVETIPSTGASNEYERFVKLEHAVLSEEEVQVKRDSGLIVTRTE